MLEGNFVEFSKGEVHRIRLLGISMKWQGKKRSTEEEGLQPFFQRTLKRCEYP
jgi:hypothetical protein